MLIPNAPAVSEMSEGLKTIPESIYHLRIHKAEYVGTPKSADAKGPYIKAQLIVVGATKPEEEQFVGRYVFQNYPLTGDGSFRLRELLQATNHPPDFKLADSDQLLNLEFKGGVTIQKGTGGYADKNQVNKHMPLI